jgi:uncharacterized membrane protein YraQ (UPF0718 family)
VRPASEQGAELEASLRVEPSRRRDLLPALAGTLGFLLIAALVLGWAKWAPYSHKLAHLWTGHAWAGKDILAQAGGAGASPSLAGAWSFTRAYFIAVWPALVAALVIAASVQALVPRRWLLRLLSRGTATRSSLAGGLLALPSLMCTCCTAPVAATLRREGAPTSAALAYWIGNPVLNPAVLAFLALVAPWQWVLTRILVGLVLVFGATVLVARVSAKSTPTRPTPTPSAEFKLGAAPAGFARSLVRLAVTLLPEYLVVVFLLGLFRGWIFPLGLGGAHWGILAIAAVLGTLIVIPTGGEIPILQGLAGAGVGAGALGALLITLPAISLVSMAMVARTFSVRVTITMAAAVAACGLLGGLLLLVLTM